MLVGSDHHLGSQCQFDFLHCRSYHPKEQNVHGYNFDAVQYIHGIGWVLSKPVSRVAFIVAKLIANGIGIVVTMILAQGLIAYLISTFFILGFSLSIPGFLVALGVQFVNILFYLTLTLMLGTIFENTGPVIGISIAFLFVQNIAMSFFPVLVCYIPWTLATPANGAANPSIGMNLMAGIAAPSFMPLYVALIVIVLFVGLALWIFQRQEF